jgi:hypothetical protein
MLTTAPEDAVNAITDRILKLNSISNEQAGKEYQ